MTKQEIKEELEEIKRCYDFLGCRVQETVDKINAELEEEGVEEEEEEEEEVEEE
jgi:hypothetical protein